MDIAPTAVIAPSSRIMPSGGRAAAACSVEVAAGMGIARAGL